MRLTVKLPRLADSTDDYVVVSWEVGAGRHIDEGDPLMVVETDKADVELPSPVSGVVIELLVAVGDEVHTSQPVCVIKA